MSEALYYLLSYCSELENKSHDINSYVNLIFDQICDLCNRYSDKIEYREEIEVLLYRVLLRPFADLDQHKDDEEEKKEEDKASSSTQVSKAKAQKHKGSLFTSEFNISN